MPSDKLSLPLPELAERAQVFAEHARSERTKQTYTSAWKRYIAWCSAHGLSYLPTTPQALTLYITERAIAGRHPSSINVDLAAIGQAHKLAGFAAPRGDRVVSETARGIRRTLTRPSTGRAALSPEQLRKVLGAIPSDSLIGLRDRALLLVGFLGGFRRSELVGMKAEHVTEKAEGIVIRLFGSKDDRALVGRDVAIPASSGELCAVRALAAWRARAGIEKGYLLRSVDRHGNIGGRLSGRTVARIVKRRASAVGYDVDEISSHSLRVGYVTAAHEKGAPLESIMQVTGHKSYETAMKYIRKASLFKQHPSTDLL